MRVVITASIAAPAIGAMLVGIAAQGIAQSTYPSRDIRIVLPSTAGGSPDVIARAIANKLSAAWPHRVYVENRPGASGTIGTLEVSRAPKDGYTYLAATFGQAVGPLLLTSAKYDIVKDLEPVVMFGTTPSVVLMAPSTGINSIEELVRFAERIRKN